MYLSEIKIKNFRLFEELDLEINEGLNILVGENNSGKTALIDAIRYTLDTNSAEWINIQNEDFHKGQEEFCITLVFKRFSIKEAAPFVEYLTYDDSEKNGILYLTLQCQIGQRNKKGFIKKEYKYGKNQDGRIDGDAREHLATTYLKPLRDAETELLSKRGSRLSQILLRYADLANEDIQRKIVELIRQAFDDIKNKDKSNTESIKNAEKEISKYLKGDKLLFKEDNLHATISAAINDEKIDSEFRQILEKLDLRFRDESNNLTTRQGLGYQNILFVAVELLLLEKEQEIFKLLLIEEPEAHLHPQLQIKLLKTIQEEKNMQCILSTHSPNLASKSPVENIILMTGAKSFTLKKGKTKLKDNNDYIYLRNFLDVTKANLFFAKGVIFVEGWAEEILFPTIAALIQFPLEKYGVSVVNVGHTGLFRFSRIFQRKDEEAEWIPVKVACVRDRDLKPSCINKEKGGYIEYKKRNPAIPNSGNEETWEEYYDNSTEEKKLSKYEQKLKSDDGQYVETFISPKWTLEYDLAYCGLGEELWEALGQEESKYPSEEDKEKLAANIYKIFLTTKKSKTETAYSLVKILDNKYKDKPEDLIKKLPTYLVDAIEHVSETIPCMRVDVKNENRVNN